MKTMAAALFFGLLLTSCGNASSEKAAKEDAKAQEEIKSLDSATAVIENVNEEIETSTEEVDQLLNDL